MSGRKVPGGINYQGPEKSTGQKVGELRTIESGNQKITQRFNGEDWTDFVSASRWAPPKLGENIKDKLELYCKKKN